MTAHKSRKWSDKQQEALADQIIELRDNGVTCEACATELNISLYDVHNICRRFRLEKRWPRGRHRNAKWRETPSLIKKHEVPPVSLGVFTMRLKGMGGREREFIHILPHSEMQFDAIVEHLVACGGEVI